MSVILLFLARIKHLGAQHVSASPIANMNAFSKQMRFVVYASVICRLVHYATSQI